MDQLDGLTGEQPVLLVYEDVHWIDPTTQELLELAIERVQRLPVLLVITFRPEFAPLRAGLPHLSALPLARLGRREGAALVERVAREKGTAIVRGADHRERCRRIFRCLPRFEVSMRNVSAKTS